VRPPLALAGLLAGIILLAYALVTTVRDRRAADWPSAPGTLGWATPSCHTERTPEDVHHHTHPITVCASRIYYRYRVGERDYAGTRVTFNDALLNLFDWGWDDKYVDSPHVTLRYDPADPALAVLEPRTPGRSLLWLVGAALTIGLGRAILSNRSDAA